MNILFLLYVFTLLSSYYGTIAIDNQSVVVDTLSLRQQLAAVNTPTARVTSSKQESYSQHVEQPRPSSPGPIEEPVGSDLDSHNNSADDKESSIQDGSGKVSTDTNSMVGTESSLDVQRMAMGVGGVIALAIFIVVCRRSFVSEEGRMKEEYVSVPVDDGADGGRDGVDMELGGQEGGGGTGVALMTLGTSPAKQTTAARAAGPRTIGSLSAREGGEKRHTATVPPTATTDDLFTVSGHNSTWTREYVGGYVSS